MSLGEGGLLDLVVLVPGKDEQAIIRTLLSQRDKSLRIRPVRSQILVHPRRDPGCFHEAPQILQPYLGKADYAIVLFDHQGSGQEGRSPQDVEDDLRRRLASSGWRTRGAVVIIVPELETWVWSESPEVDVALSWEGRHPGLREWLQSQGLLREGAVKPDCPKRAVECARRAVGLPRSSAVFAELASRVSLDRCQDPAFHSLTNTLRTWFGGQSLS